MRGTFVVISLVFFGLVAAACGGGAPAPANGGAASPAPSSSSTGADRACTGG